MKYIHFDDSNDTIILFPDHIDHGAMAAAYGKPVYSAGFVTHYNGWFECYGESISLQVESVPDLDSKLANKLFK